MLKTSLKIGYLSSENPTNKKVWSGTHYSIYKHLSTFAEVTPLGPYEPKLRLWIAKFVNQFYLKVLNKRYSYRHSIFISKGYANYFNKKLKEKKYDYIIAPAASCELALVETDIPIIYISDGTFASCLNYHDSLKNLTERSIKEGNFIEQQAIQKSKFVIVSSEWAKTSAMTDYKADSAKVNIIPFGANFDRLPEKNELEFSAPVEWKILFVGVYWENKGGDIAYNAFKLLLEKGYNVSLTVLGCIPPAQFSHPKMDVISFIDKNDPKGQEELNTIYKQHHFLILPTRFDCTPIVINEASAYGMPCIVSNTGGVAGHLKEEKNGFLVDYSDKGKGYAETISRLIDHPAEYTELRKETRKLYDELLNWNNWTSQLKKIIENS
ncbi:MAG: glycosyltransferase family 4 protein [Bacteroidetes bacterium]|nr:glycosyltransferase family 4 protein [Bacteroidota bacterium]